MKSLIALTQVTEKIKLKTSDLIFSDAHKMSKEYIFLQKIIANDFKTDEDAAHFFYQSKTSDSKYKNLKRTLKTNY